MCVSVKGSIGEGALCFGRGPSCLSSWSGLVWFFLLGGSWVVVTGSRHGWFRVCCRLWRWSRRCSICRSILRWYCRRSGSIPTGSRESKSCDITVRSEHHQRQQHSSSKRDHGPQKFGSQPCKTHGPPGAAVRQVPRYLQRCRRTHGLHGNPPKSLEPESLRCLLLAPAPSTPPSRPAQAIGQPSSDGSPRRGLLSAQHPRGRPVLLHPAGVCTGIVAIDGR